MHILLIHQAFASNSDPGGTRHFEFARHFASAGHRTTVVGGAVSYLTSGRLDPERHDGIDVIRPYTYGALHRSFLARLFSFVTFMVSSFVAGVRVRNVDVVFGTSPPIFQGLTAWAISRVKRVPFVLEIRDLWPDFAVEMGVLQNPVAIRLSRALERFLYRQADRIVVNSPGFIEHVSRVGGRTPTLVSNGVDVSQFVASEGRERLRHAWGVDGRFVVLYAGAHGPANDLTTALAAAKLLRGRIDVVLVCVGDGKDKPALRRQAEAEGIDNVLFVDPQPKREMAAVLAAADAGLAILQDLPLFRTTYPNKVFDYMAAGKPCIVAIDGVIRAVIEQAQCGVWVRPGSAQDLAAAVERLAADPAASVAMGARGREYVAMHFSRETHAAAMMALLTGAVDDAAA